MTPLGVRRILTALGVNQCEFARRLRIDPRTVRNWVRYGSPLHAAKVLTLLHAGKITWNEAALMVLERRRRRLSP